MVRSFGAASAASGKVQIGKMREIQWKKEMVRGRWVEEEDRGKFQDGKTKNFSEMRRPSKIARCTLSNGSAWSTEKKFLVEYNGTFDIFHGIEHRMRREEMEGQFSRKAKQRPRFAADAARFTDDNESSENCKHTSGGVFVVTNSD